MWDDDKNKNKYCCFVFFTLCSIKMKMDDFIYFNELLHLLSNFGYGIICFFFLLLLYFMMVYFVLIFKF